MKILIVAATEAEISPLRDIWFSNHQLTYLVTGVGMVATTYELTCKLKQESFDLVLNCGLAGSFDRSLKIGEVVRVAEDIFSELGAEDDDSFLSLKEMGLDGTDILINADEQTPKVIHDYRRVRSITVNTVHGNENSIKKVLGKFKPQVETMEGGAVFYVCGKENISCLQLRAISNYVEKRNKASWNIPLALSHLKTSVADVINKI